MKRLLAQLSKFGVVGVLATTLDYALFAVLAKVFGVSYLIANTASFSISTVFNYAASMSFVFEHKDNLSRSSEFIIFIVLSIIGLGLNDFFMWLGVGVLGVDSLIMKIVATAIVMVYNFCSRKLLLDGGR